MALDYEIPQKILSATLAIKGINQNVRIRQKLFYRSQNYRPFKEVGMRDSRSTALLMNEETSRSRHTANR